jgi:hypothetical protein
MFRWFVKLLPFCFVVWYAKKNCEIWNINSIEMVKPFPNIWIVTGFPLSNDET